MLACVTATEPTYLAGELTHVRTAASCYSAFCHRTTQPSQVQSDEKTSAAR